jgi:hypothetical protein
MLGTAVAIHSFSLRRYRVARACYARRFGPAIARFLEDPAVIEVMLNPDGRPITAYQSAFDLSAVLQLAALVWFTLPWLWHFGKKLIHLLIAECEPA